MSAEHLSSDLIFRRTPQSWWTVVVVWVIALAVWWLT